MSDDQPRHYRYVWNDRIIGEVIQYLVVNV
jgi:hypothetical protein